GEAQCAGADGRAGAGACAARARGPGPAARLGDEVDPQRHRRVLCEPRLLDERKSMARRSAAHSHAAREAWRALFDAFMLTHPERQATLGRYGLTPNDSRALYSLDRKDGRAI